MNELMVLLQLLAMLFLFGVYPLPLMSIANQTAVAMARFFAG